MAKDNEEKKYNTLLEISVENSLQYVTDFFRGDKELIHLYMEVQNQMMECDPDLLFCKRNGIIGLAKRDEKFRFYISPAEDSYDIKFLHINEKMSFVVERLKQYLNECEEAVMYALRNPKTLSYVDDDVDETEEVCLDNFLNRSQRKFCKLASGKNVRLLAPAGAGKTYSILWRCKHITEDYKKKGKNPPYFLLITFTKSACIELENRLKSESAFSGIRATVRTLNAWGWEQNKKQGKELALNKFERRNLVTHDLFPICKKYDALANAIKSPKGKIVNSDTLMELIDLLKSLGFKHTMTKLKYKAHVKELKELGLISILESGYDELYKMENIQGDDKKIKDKAVSDFFNFWKKAVVRLEENNRYTFEDQKYWAEQYIREKIEAKKFPQGVTKYTHIIVDEFQDINPLDLDLIKTIGMFHGKGKNISLTIVGDDDQAIFGWRGTTPKYILYPDKYFNMRFETNDLNVNYRSPKNIVELSKNLIEHNQEREPKEMKSAAKGRAYVKVLSRQKMSSAIDATMRLIHELIEEKGCQQVALIGRKQASIFPYQVLLSAEGTNYNVDADIDIFEGEAMRSLQEIIKIIYRAKDYDNDDPCGDLLTVCDKVYRYGIKKSEKNNLMDYLEQNGADSFEGAMELLKEYPGLIKNDSSVILYEAIKQLYTARSVYQFMQKVEEKLEGLGKDYSKKDTDNHYKEPQFFRLTELSKKYGDDYRKFYRDIEKARRNGERSRNRNADETGNGYKEKNEIPVHLMTATRSKGHEFDAVIILEAYDREWPHYLTKDIEEERRLFYVAMTRAKKYLYFTTSADEKSSRFIEEMGI